MLLTKADDVSQLEPFPHKLIFLAILLLLPVLQAGAQQTGAIRGRVLDQSGAVMPGVTVGAGRRISLDTVLKVTLDKQRVDVSSDQPVGVEPEANAGAIGGGAAGNRKIELQRRFSF